MICGECFTAGVKSRVYEGGTTSTCMAFSAYYDEDGKYHMHDPNARATSYSCSNGHRWHETRSPKCPTCGDWRKS